MEKVFNNAEDFATSVRDYADARIDEVKLSVAEKTSAVIANLAARIIVVMVFVFFIFFAGIALALLLSEWLGKWWIGFLIVAGFFLLAAIVAWIAREKLFRLPLMNAIIAQLFKKDEDEED
jgi:uncharacterized membrane protein YdbT with pleckstrin-like domain